MPEKRRTVEEIRRSLRATHEQIEEDLDTLGERLHSNLNVRHQLVRHPVLIVLAGAVAGYVLVKRPTVLTQALRRLAGWGAPLVLSALLRSPKASGRKESGAGEQ